MSDHSMVRHLAEFLGIERSWFAEQALVHRNFPDVVQIAGGAQGRNITRFHPHGFPDSSGITSHSQRVAMNVDMLYIDRIGEGLQRGVVETMQGSQQAQVF